MATTLHNQEYYILDAVHKSINISEPVIKALIACREFQRLRWISQLGGAQIAFPSATHTRFSHSIGVFHLLDRILNILPSAQNLSKEAKLHIKIAGLLHDLGHGPFSHAFEKIINLNNKQTITFSHENYTCAIINDSNTEINKVLRQYKININHILGIIKKDIINFPKYQIQLVSSQLDCDRIDYLMRDGYFTGVEYGNIDLEWLVTNMIIDDEKGLIFSYKAVSAIENYLITRFHMYSQVYYHRTGIIFDINLQKLFARLTTLYFDKNYDFTIAINNFHPLFTGEMVSIASYLTWTDATIINLVQNIIADEKDETLLKIAHALLFSANSKNELAQLNVNKNPDIIAQKLTNVLYDFQGDEILIVNEKGVLTPLAKISPILQNPAKIEITTYLLKQK